MTVSRVLGGVRGLGQTALPRPIMSLSPSRWQYRFTSPDAKYRNQAKAGQAGFFWRGRAHDRDSGQVRAYFLTNSSEALGHWRHEEAPDPRQMRAASRTSGIVNQRWALLFPGTRAPLSRGVMDPSNDRTSDVLTRKDLRPDVPHLARLPKSTSMPFSGNRVCGTCNAIVSGHHAVVVDEIGTPSPGRKTRALSFLDMQMRSRARRNCRPRQERPRFTRSPTLTPTSWLQMAVVDKLPAANVQRDGVAGNGLHCDGYGRMERVIVSRHIIGETVPCRDHSSICNREDGFPIRKIRVLVACIAGECRATFDLLPIDGIPSGNHRTRTHDEDATPVMVVRVIARSIEGAPIRAFHRWSEHMQLRVMCVDHGPFEVEIGCHHAMQQFVWNRRSAVKRNRHERHDTAASHELAMVVTCICDDLSAEWLQDFIELSALAAAGSLCLSGIQHFNSTGTGRFQRF